MADYDMSYGEEWGPPEEQDQDSFYGAYQPDMGTNWGPPEEQNQESFYNNNFGNNQNQNESNLNWGPPQEGFEDSFYNNQGQYEPNLKWGPPQENYQDSFYRGGINSSDASGGAGTNWGQMAGNAMTSGKDFLSSLFRSTPGSPSTAAMLSPFLAALYNKKTAPAQAAATNQYIQGQQQRLDPFGGYRGEANQNWQASNQRLMDLKNNRNLSPEMLAQDALSKYTVGRQDARGSNRFNNGRTQLMAGLANQRNLIQDEMKLNEMYGRQGGAGFNPSGLEGILKQGLAANQNAANPLMQLFAALGQTTNSFSPQTQLGQY